MDLKRAPTIRSRLTLLVIACIVPSFVFMAIWVVYDYDNERNELTRQTIARARAIVTTVDRDVAGIQAGLSVLATSPYLASDNLPAFYEQAKAAQAALNVNNIVLIDGTHAQRVNTLRPLNAVPVVSHAPWLDTVFEQGHPVVTDLFVGPVAGKPVVIVAVPVYVNTELKYVLGAGIWPDRLAELLNKQSLPADWIAGIFDSTGTIVARSRNMDKYLGTKGTPAVVGQMLKLAEGSVETETLEGIPVILVFSRSSVSNWAVAVGIPSRTLLQELWTSLSWLLAATLILLFASIGLGWLIAGKITRAVKSLSSAARRLGRGSEAMMISGSGLREVDEVGEALAKTSAKLFHAEHKAHHDDLTGLSNRQLYREFANMQLDMSKRDGSELSLLFIDLDGFKNVNDQHGHDIGDRLLCEVANRLRSTLRASDTAARFGGDEFAALLPRTDAGAAAQVASKLVDNISAPYKIGNAFLEISASIGISNFPRSARDIEELLKRADDAMYRVKSGGKRGYAMATPWSDQQPKTDIPLTLPDD